MFAINQENLNTLKYHIFKKTDLSIVYNKCGNEPKKFFKEDSIEILKILALITNVEEYQKLHNHV